MFYETKAQDHLEQQGFAILPGAWTTVFAKLFSSGDCPSLRW